MAEFNPDLHAFLLENEMCIWATKGTLEFGVHVCFSEISEFIDLVGNHLLDDGGIDANLNNTRTLFIPLHDYFINENLQLAHYKYCFDEDDFKAYAEEIKQFDSE